MNPIVRLLDQSQPAWTPYRSTKVREGAARWRRALQEEDLNAGINAGMPLQRIWMERRSTLSVPR